MKNKETNQMEQPHECPFCTGTKILMIGQDGSGVVVRCGQCGAMAAPGKDSGEAIAHWNRRELEKDMRRTIDRQTDMLEDATRKMELCLLQFQAFADIGNRMEKLRLDMEEVNRKYPQANQEAKP